MLLFILSRNFSTAIFYCQCFGWYILSGYLLLQKSSFVPTVSKYSLISTFSSIFFICHLFNTAKRFGFIANVMLLPNQITHLDQHNLSTIQSETVLSFTPPVSSLHYILSSSSLHANVDHDCVNTVLQYVINMDGIRQSGFGIVKIMLHHYETVYM